jgi:hypothetical protein
LPEAGRALWSSASINGAAGPERPIVTGAPESFDLGLEGQMRACSALDGLVTF